jgi:hypothetical protein
MIRIVICLLLLLSVVACKSKKKEPQEGFFNVKSYILAQIRQVDTSLFRITLINMRDTLSDTSIIPREKFRDAAAPFVSLPDISDEDHRENYTESKIFDPEINSVLLTYTTQDQEEEVRRETVLLSMNDKQESEVNTLIINRIKNSKDSTVEQDLTWRIGSHFQVVTKVRKTGQPERLSRYQVRWNDFSH